jgi:uncharacterized coiled-coil protein SlyX
MKTKSLIATIVGATLLQYGSLQANAQTSDSANLPPEPGSEAVKVGDKLISPKLSLKAQNQSVFQLLHDDITSQDGMNLGWDEDKQRYVGVCKQAIPISSPVTAGKLVSTLNQANLIMTMVALQDFATFLGTKSDFQANLSMGGSPVGRLYMKDQERFQDEMDALEGKLAKVKSKQLEAETTINAANAVEVAAQKELDAKIAEQEKIVQNLNRKAVYGPSTLDRLAIASEALVKKIDTNYSNGAFKSEAAADKEKANDELQALKTEKGAVQSEKMKAAKADYETLQSEIKKLADDIKSKKEEALKRFADYNEHHLVANYNYSCDYDIVGLTPIKFYYGIEPTPNGQQLVVAEAYAWSPALERDARAIIAEYGDASQKLEDQKYMERFKLSELQVKKGEKSLKAWLAEQKKNPDTFGNGRWYLDDKGVRYWLGCAYALKGYGATEDSNYRSVRLDAGRNLGLSLNVKFQVKGTKRDDLVFNDTDSEISSKLQQVSEISRQGIDISDEADTGVFTISESSEPVVFYIAKVSQKTLVAAHNITLEMAQDAARQHEAANYREGVRKAANDFVKSAKDNKIPYGKGYNSAKNDLNANSQPVATKSQNKAGDAKDNTILIKTGTNAPTQDNIKPFIKGDKSKIPDDF